MNAETKRQKASRGPVTKIYRIALYGRKSSGKTCILAALAMDRILNSEKLTCTWLRQPSKDWIRHSAQAADVSAPEVTAAYESGRDWLEKAIGALEQGLVPPGNPNDAETFRFAYEFTGTDHRVYRVELIDYSGELIDPALDSDVSPLAGRLRKQMQTMDAILVLAEAPSPKRPVKELHRELGRLRQAFAALRGEKQTGPTFDTPVVLLINKWDRRERNQRFTAELGQVEVRAFMDSEPEPPHRTLEQVLRNSVAEGDFRCCPMSAFGPGAQVDSKGMERPGQVEPLLSYGLEDGFVWAARQRDRIDLEKLEDWTNRQGWWKLWQMGGEAPPVAASLANRFPARSEEKRRVSRAMWGTRLAGVGRMCTVLVLMAAAVLGMEAGLDYQAHRSVQATLANPVADEKQLEKAEAWVNAYAHSPSYRHLVFNLSYHRDKALAQVKALQAERHDKLYARVVEAGNDLIRQEKLAIEMIAAFPNSTKMAELIDIRTKAEISRKKNENHEAIARLDGLLQQMISGQIEDQDQYLPLQQKIDNLPLHKDAESEENRKGRTDLLTKLNQRLEEIARLDIDRKNVKNQETIKGWQGRIASLKEVEELQELLRGISKGLPYATVATQDLVSQHQKVQREAQLALDKANRLRELLAFQGKVQRMMTDNLLTDAAREICERRSSDPAPEVEKLKKTFIEQCVPKLKRYKDDKVIDKQWSQAKEFLQKVREDARVKELLDDPLKLREIEDLEYSVDVAHDSHLYQRVLSRRDKLSCDDYLANAPVKKRQTEVKQFRDHLTTMEGPLSLKLELASIFWGGWWNNYKNDVSVFVDNNKVVFSNNALSTKKTTIENVGSGFFTARLSDEITLFGSAITNNAPIVNSDLVTGAIKRTARDLVGKNQTIPLSIDNIEFRVRIDPESLPKAPALPGWGD